MNRFGLTQNVLTNFEVVSFKPKHLDNLKFLFDESFGRLTEVRGLLNKDILRHYRLVFDGEVPVAVTAVLPAEQSMFNGYEVGWTCTNQRYRGSGICTELLRECISGLPEDGIPVFCNCWRFPGKQVGLFNAMQGNGFQLLVPEASVFSSKFSKLCSSCPYRQDGETSCRCYADVWRLER